MSNHAQLVHVIFTCTVICFLYLVPLTHCIRRRQQPPSSGDHDDYNTKTQLAVKLGSKWMFVGPFIIGKTEIDADPLAAFSQFKADNGEVCYLQQILRRVKGEL